MVLWLMLMYKMYVHCARVLSNSNYTDCNAYKLGYCCTMYFIMYKRD